MLPKIPLCLRKPNPWRECDVGAAKLIVPRCPLIEYLKHAKHRADARSDSKQFQRFATQSTPKARWFVMLTDHFQTADPFSGSSSPETCRDAEVNERPRNDQREPKWNQKPRKRPGPFKNPTCADHDKRNREKAEWTINHEREDSQTDFHTGSPSALHWHSFKTLFDELCDRTFVRPPII